MGKTPVGSVAIKVSHNRLQLVYRCAGKREYLSLGLPDTKRNRAYAGTIASQIEVDILTGRYDTTKAKYKLLGSEPKPQDPTPKIDLMELWERYVEYKRPQVSLNTLSHDYHQVERWLIKMPYSSIDDAIEIRGYLLKHSTPDSTRRILNQLAKACVWGMKSNVVSSNTFEGLAVELNIKKSRKEIDYFTVEERDRIIQYFRECDAHYAPLVEFMFRAGCRPSEALALEWGDISEGLDVIVFSRALTYNQHGTRTGVKEGLKTQDRRTVPAGKTLVAFLQSIAPTDRKPKNLVFPSPKGTYIDLANFGKRHWRPALVALNLKHRSFYTCRHTAITHALDSLDAKDVAALVGNSADVIYRHYAGIKEGLTTPDF